MQRADQKAEHQSLLQSKSRHDWLLVNPTMLCNVHLRHASILEHSAVINPDICAMLQKRKKERASLPLQKRLGMYQMHQQ